MNIERESFDETAEKILAGVRKAVRQMVEENALKNETIVIGESDGTVRHVPARDLLKKYK